MRINYLIEKEFNQIRRNIILPVVFIILPVALMNIIPRVATQEVKNLKFCVIDNDHSSLSRRLIQKIDASEYLLFTVYAQSEVEAMEAIDAADADLFVEIPQGFEKMFVTGVADANNIYVAANATNGIKAAMGQNYVQQIIISFLQDEVAVQPQSNATAQPPSLRFVFNHRLDYKIYMIPAVFALMLTLIVGFLPSLNIVGEKERGTIEQVNVTPIGKLEFILSKLIPYWLIGLAMSVIALFMGRVLFDISPAGNVLVMFLFILIFCILISSFALVISNYSDTTSQAALTMFFFLVIFILMSGLLTPICSMPEWAQWISMLDPMRHIIEALRLIYVKGSTFSELMPQFHALMLYALAMSTWAVFSYKKSS